MNSTDSVLNQQRSDTYQENKLDQADNLILIQSPTPSNLSEVTTYSDQRTGSKSSATTTASSKSSNLSPQKSHFSGAKQSRTESSSLASFSSTPVKNDSKADTITESSKQSNSVLSTSVLSQSPSPNDSNTRQTPDSFTSQISSYPNMSSPHTTNVTRTDTIARPETSRSPEQTPSAMIEAHIDSYTSLNKKPSASA